MMSVIGRCLLPVLMVGFAWVGGCGPTTGALCEDQRQCMGGNDKDEDACVALVDYSEEMADVQGCSDEFDDYFECFYDNATCQTAQTGYNCQSAQDCTSAGYGATCEGGSCVVKRLDLENNDVCRREANAYDSCSALNVGIF